MGRRIFVSYKYADNDVKELRKRNNASKPTTARDYVNDLEKRIDKSDSIFQGEHDDDDLSGLSDDTIRSKLCDKIFDNSVTILMISPKMKSPNCSDRNQWIPWEILYSVHTEKRKNGKSEPNALLGVVLPDKRGKYDYFKKMDFLGILERNMKAGYMDAVKWSSFIANMDHYLEVAVANKGEALHDATV